MCELFAMSSRVAATVSFSFEEFSRHGGESGPHRDGWGVAWYDDGDVRIVREPAPAASSLCVRHLQESPFASALVVSHIRRATQGRPSLRNTQPFVRELGGRIHVFAHNGDLKDARGHPALPTGTFRPVGDTDSEQAFCALLERLRELWMGAVAPTEEDRREVVLAFAETIRPLGPANFIYSDGELLFAHGHRRRAGGPVARPPGLHVLTRTCDSGGTIVSDGVAVRSGGPQQVVLLASVPLTSERWRPLDEGELVVVRAGLPLPG
jgi:glutamine amidotransferase